MAGRTRDEDTDDGESPSRKKPKTSSVYVAAVANGIGNETKSFSSGFLLPQLPSFRNPLKMLSTSPNRGPHRAGGDLRPGFRPSAPEEEEPPPNPFLNPGRRAPSPRKCRSGTEIDPSRDSSKAVSAPVPIRRSSPSSPEGGLNGCARGLLASLNSSERGDYYPSVETPCNSPTGVLALPTRSVDGLAQSLSAVPAFVVAGGRSYRTFSDDADSADDDA